MNAITVDKVRTFVPMFGAWLKTGWVYLAAFAGGLLIFSHFFTFAVNASDSLPQRAFLVMKYDKALKPGDYVAFTWKGTMPYPKGLNFVKRVGGVGGQFVEERNREFFVDGVSMGVAKTHGSRGNMMGVPLETGRVGVIPTGSVYANADHKDSLDSRYALMGWISNEVILGRAVPLF